jgi:seryl-tRNA synthetase
MNIKIVIEQAALYQKELVKRGMKIELIEELTTNYSLALENLKALEEKQRVKNEFNTRVIKLDGEAKQEAIVSMKQHSIELKELQDKQRELDTKVEQLYLHIPQLSSEQTPVGESDEDNVVLSEYGMKPEYSFEPKPYYQLPAVAAYISQAEGTKVTGSRGYYLRGQIALFQKALFEIAQDIILSHGLELMYVPLMLNEETLVGTGHLPDFDGQMYEVKVTEDKSFYLIGSSEPALMAYYKDTLITDLHHPVHITADTMCFRKEAGSYGKDQQGILRVHQFRKIEMIAICKAEDNARLFDLHAQINREILDVFGLHYREVEVCTGDLPVKHYRQTDFEAWFPGEGKFREVASNGSAGSYQTSRLNSKFRNEFGNLDFPWSLNCTGLTFRTGLAILEQNQQIDGSVKLPQVIADKVGFESIKMSN